MLRKFIFTAAVLSATPFAYAKHSDTTLTVAPNAPSTWEYVSSLLIINNYFRMSIGDGITIPVQTGDEVDLMVRAMNAQPRLHDSCRGIQIKSEGKHQLLFELQKDWMIHCQYS